MTRKTYEWRDSSGSGKFVLQGVTYDAFWTVEWLQTVLHSRTYGGDSRIDGMKDNLTLNVIIPAATFPADARSKLPKKFESTSIRFGDEAVGTAYLQSFKEKDGYVMLTLGNSWE